MRWQVLGWIPTLALALGAGAGCDDDPRWPGRYEGRFDGTYVATGRMLEGKANLVRSTFAGNAWIQIQPREDGRLDVHVTDCDIVWDVDDAVATFPGEPVPTGCLLDVSGSVGVLGVRPTSGRATLRGDRLELQYSAVGPPREEAERPSNLSFHFEGTRAR